MHALLGAQGGVSGIALRLRGAYQWQVGGQDAAAIQVQAEGVAGFDKADNELYSGLLSETRQGAEQCMSAQIMEPDFNGLAQSTGAILMLEKAKQRGVPMGGN